MNAHLYEERKGGPPARQLFSSQRLSGRGVNLSLSRLGASVSSLVFTLWVVAAGQKEIHRKREPK
jgi:hypothetical protein